MTRRFVTRATVEAAIARGETTMELSGAVTVTDEAAARARERGLVFVREGEAVAGRSTPTSAVAPVVAGAPSQGTAPVDRDAVRRAVVGVLGRVPPELDGVLDRILGPGPADR